MAQVLSVFVVHGGEYFFDVQFCQYFEGFRGLFCKEEGSKELTMAFVSSGDPRCLMGFISIFSFFILWVQSYCGGLQFCKVSVDGFVKRK